MPSHTHLRANTIKLIGSTLSLPPPQILGTELHAQQPLLNEAEQDLQRAKKCSSTLANRFQEHCPDIERQEAELHKLNQRFSNLGKQIEHR